jgi:PadR family transcriptional regulator AphA
MRIENVLLALISRRPRSGYELKKWLDVEGIFLRANADQAQIYRTLRRLQADGLIDHNVIRKSGPDAKVFRITDEGARALRALAETPYEPPARWQEADFIAHVSLLGPVHPPAILDAIETEIEFREAQVGQFRGRDLRIDIEEGPIPYEDAILGPLAADLDEFGRKSTDAWLSWLRKMKSEWSARLAH